MLRHVFSILFALIIFSAPVMAEDLAGGGNPPPAAEDKSVNAPSTDGAGVAVPTGQLFPGYKSADVPTTVNDNADKTTGSTGTTTAAVPTTPDNNAGKTQVVDKDGDIFTFWPLVYYKTDPAEKSSELSVLGPLFSRDRTKDSVITAFRPLFHTESSIKGDNTSTTYLYPIASSTSNPDVTRFQIIQLFQKDIFRKSDPDEANREKQFMIFPFIIKGESKKYGPYFSLFPIYGTIYERFWRDEYHFILFPIYGSTVKNGTTNYNFLYPIFSVTSGKNESGFQFWPLFGFASKEGVYSRQFVLWPIFAHEKRGLDTDNPTKTLTIFPFYSATDSPKIHSRIWLWPFFGYTKDDIKKEEEKDYFWPLVRTVRGEKRTVNSYLPFYSEETTDETTKNWYMWPVYRHDTITSKWFCQERQRVLYFVFNNRTETWPVDGATRKRTALWPFFLYRKDTKGEKFFSFPAPVESVLDKDGIEGSWAPFWRLYVQKWNDNGDSSVSFLWHLYWQDIKKDSTAWELFPLVRYRNSKTLNEVQVLKGLVNYKKTPEKSSLRLLWLPFGFSWSHAEESTK